MSEVTCGRGRPVLLLLALTSNDVRMCVCGAVDGAGYLGRRSHKVALVLLRCCQAVCGRFVW